MAEQGSPTDDARFMQRAIELALRARPSPNPRVGAVVVRDRVIVGEGFHHRAGSDHGEIEAVKHAGSAAHGATVYVTLEPCNHHGLTPPCTESLLRAGVRTVVVGSRDPNPNVRRGGIEQLRAGGIEVREGIEREACDRLIAAWRTFVTTGRPYVVLKTAMTLDGRIATRTGESRWITGPEARRDAHRLRARADAVLVGIGTVLADDPLLTPRDVDLPAPPPRRVVLDSNLRTPVGCALVRSARDVPVLIAHADDAPADRIAALTGAGAELLAFPREGGSIALAPVLDALGRRGTVELLVEGGGIVHGALLDQRAADALVCYMAPALLGGNDARPAFGGRGVASLAEAHRLRGLRVEPVGVDVKLTAEFEHVHGNHHGGR